jgi:hypothetical protein
LASSQLPFFCLFSTFSLGNKVVSSEHRPNPSYLTYFLWICNLSPQLECKGHQARDFILSPLPWRCQVYSRYVRIMFLFWNLSKSELWGMHIICALFASTKLTRL